MDPTTILGSLLYEPLRESDEIRIVALYGGLDNETIRIRLFHLQISAPQCPWTALSYVWGAPTPTSTIVCNERPFEVTENLYGALLHLRTLEVGTDPETFKCFWIDAICINQGDNDEKSKQVPLMASIYRAATGVTMWLGPSSRDSGLAMAALHEWGAFAVKNTGELPNMRRARWRVSFGNMFRQDPHINAKADAVSALGRRPWFTRAWCFQEVVLAGSSAILLCGRDSIPIETFMMALEGVIAGGFNDRLFGGNPNVVTIARSRFVYHDKRYARTNTWQLAHMIEQTEYQEATNPRDKIYALLGMLSSTSPAAEEFVRKHCPTRYEPPVNHVYTHYARTMIVQSWNLRILTQCYRGQDAAAVDLPSWVPDWRIRSHLQPLCQFESATWEAMRGNSHEYPRFFDFAPKSGIICLHLRGWSYGKIREVYQIHDFLPPINAEGLGPGNLRWVREMHDAFGLGTKNRGRRGDYDSVLEFMYVLSGGNLPSMWHKLSWADSRAKFPAHFQYESANQNWLSHDGTMWNDFRDAMLLDEGWRDDQRTWGKRDSTLDSPEINEGLIAIYIANAYEKMLGVKKSTLRSAVQKYANIGDSFDPRYSGSRKNHFADPGVQAAMAAEVLRFIRETMNRRVFFLLEDNTMGIGPATTRVGDSLYEFGGGYCPFVLRRADRPEGFIDSLDKPASEHYAHRHCEGTGNDGEFTLVGDAHIQPDGNRIYMGSNLSDQFIRGAPRMDSTGFKVTPWGLTNWISKVAGTPREVVLL